MPTNTKTKSSMQVKAVKRFVKRVKRTFSRHHDHPATDAANSALPPTSHVPNPGSPLLDAFVVDRALSPPPITQPASPRSGTSSETLSRSLSGSTHHEKEMSDGTHSEADESATTSGEHSISEAESSSAVTRESVHSDAPRKEVLQSHAEVLSEQGSASSLSASAPEGSSRAVEEKQLPSPTPVAAEFRDSGDVPLVVSPPPGHADPEVPDPFLVDDPEDPLSDDEASVSKATSDVNLAESQQSIPPAEEISLARPSSTPADPSPIPSPSLNVNKAVPPPPAPESDEDEEQAPEIYLPQLVIPTMFLPIPNSDPLTTLLTKYIPQPDIRPVRDLTGDWQRSDFHTLVMTNSWRALARMARDRLVTTDPEDLNLVLGLWYLRLACLSRLRLFNQTSAECTNLFSVLNAIESPAARNYLFDRILPFELEVMYARLKYWAGDHMAYLDSLYALLQKCKVKARRCPKSDAVGLSMWQERGSRVCLIIASQLMEMKDFAAAAKLLEPLCRKSPGFSSPTLQSSVARIYLQGGYLAMASKHFTAVASDPNADQSMKDMNAALLASAHGDWPQASQILKTILSYDTENFVAVNNLSVALLSQGRLKEGIEVLEKALRASPSSVVVAEPFLFNLSTLYELRSATAVDKKRDLLIEVAKWSGDGLKTACLKMPSN